MVSAHSGPHGGPHGFDGGRRGRPRRGGFGRRGGGPRGGPFGGPFPGRGPGSGPGGPGFGDLGVDGPRGGPAGPGFGGPGFGGPGGRGPHGGRRGRGPRRPRGDVRLAVLALLSEEPMHGYQILGEIAERSGGSWRPSPGSVYPTVSQLADEGLVRSEKEEGRSVVHLTEEGRRYADEHRAELDGVWAPVAGSGDEDLAALRTAADGLMGAAGQVAEAGTPAQVAEAVRLLDETRRRLYLVLAGASDTPTTDAGAPEPGPASDEPGATPT